MPAIPAALYQPIKETLLDCGPFASAAALRAAFAHADLFPWRHQLPTAGSGDALAGEVMALLIDRAQADSGENGLVLLLQTLRDDAPEGGGCRERLDALATALRQALAAGGRLSLLQPPPPPNPYLNQEKLRQEMLAALRTRPGTIHTLVGLGGVGKTALAAHLAQEVQPDFSRVLWVSLAHNPPPDTVWVDLCRAYATPAGADPAATAAALLHRHRPLLVLDNAETAAATCAALLDHHAAATVLVTSRDRAVAATHSRPRPVEVLPRPEAVTLFCELTGRAAGATPEADELCALLGDLPQAIILAAGYLNSYDPPLADYLARLRRSPLGQTLHLADRRDLSVPVTFDLSFDRLDAAAGQLLALLALDGGESSGRAALAAGLAWPDADPRLDAALGDLVRHSLAGRQGERYALHPLVRRHALDRLPPDEADALAARLVAHYLAYAEAHKRPDPAAYDALEAERPNLLAAMERAVEQQQWPLVRRFAWALDNFLDTRGYWAESRRRLAQALRAAQAEGDRWQEAAFSHNLAIAAQNAGEYAAAREHYAASLAIKKEVGNRPGMAITIGQLAVLTYKEGDLAEAERLYRQAMALGQEIGDVVGLSIDMFNLALLYEDQARLAEALPLLEQVVAIDEKVGLPDLESDRQVLNRVRQKLAAT
ncbi:MAG: tetratricopeptide repeat protein [Ardenticatenaceae bacterium]|nr:tetratricopeptide repeat protein [Ardenticatenaceae bacterium]